MTKVEAIKKVMLDNEGVADWSVIYDNIEKYRPTIKKPKTWKAGIRGVLLREIHNNRNFKRISFSIYALQDYQEEELPENSDKPRMHTFMEGICLELGNFKKFLTYTADPSVVFRDNTKLGNLTSLKALPLFTYSEIVSEVKNIDVIWLNKKGFKFPQKVFEIVDSGNTMLGAFSRIFQLLNFKTEYYIIAPEQHRKKFDKQIKLAPYNEHFNKFNFVNYDEMMELHKTSVKTNKLEGNIFNF